MPDEKTGDVKLSLPQREDWGLTPRRQGRPWWGLVSVLFLVAILLLQVYSLSTDRQRTVPEASNAETARGSLSGIPLKDLSARLQRSNLPSAAALVLEERLKTLSPDQKDDQRKTLVTLGNLLMKADRYQEAIVRFYQAEYLHPDPETQSYIDLQVQTCLEKLGKFDELQYELADRTQLEGRSQGRPGDEAANRVVARIGVKPITASDLDAMISEQVDLQLDAIAGLAPEERMAYRERLVKEFQDPRRRLQTLQEMVARDVLYREGMAEGLDKSTRVRKELERVRKGLIAQQVVRQAMEDIKITEGDLQLYFDAQGDRYIEKASAQVRLALLETESAAKEALTSIQSEEDFASMAKEKSTHEASRSNGGLLDPPVVAGAPFPGLGHEPELTQAVLSTTAGQPLTDPVKVRQGFAIAFVVKKKPEHRPSFNEVREQVARDYTQRKQQEIQQKLIETLMAKHAVNIHTEEFLSSEEEVPAEDPGKN